MKLKELLRAIPQSTDIKIYLDGIYEEKKLITDYTEYKENEVLIVAPSYNEDDVICIALKKSDILDEEEKKYLSNVIKPFRDRVIAIRKMTVCYENKKFIMIILNSEFETSKREIINLPNFKNDMMYKNMKENYSYTLKDLGL